MNTSWFGAYHSISSEKICVNRICLITRMFSISLTIMLFLIRSLECQLVYWVLIAGMGRRGAGGEISSSKSCWEILSHLLSYIYYQVLICVQGIWKRGCKPAEGGSVWSLWFSHALKGWKHQIFLLMFYLEKQMNIMLYWTNNWADNRADLKKSAFHVWCYNENMGLLVIKN